MTRHGLCTVMLAALLTAGCGAASVTLGDRPATEQELVIRSLQRSVARLDTARFEGRRVTLDLSGLGKDTAFAKEFLTTKLRAKGIHVVDWKETPDVQLKAFALVLGIDQTETLIGIPALQVPVVAVPIPEIALFKWSRNRGHSGIEIYAFDPATGRYVDYVPEAEGRSKFDQFKILLVISFSVSDLEAKPPVDRPQKSSAAQ